MSTLPTSLSAAPARRRYHFHPPGVVYVVVTLFIAVGALNSQNNLLFAALGLAMGGLLVSGLVSGTALMGLRVQREVLGPAVAGRPVAIRYTVINTNRWTPAFALHVEEVPARRGVAGWRGFFAGPRAFVAHVPSRGRARVEALVVPRRRGEARLSAVRVWTTFPFGLARKSLTFEIEETVVVRPAELRLRPEVLERLVARTPSGMGAAPIPGSGEEFFGVREYVAGDSPRWIAWRASARTGQLVVRQHSSPSPARLWVVIRLGRPGDEAADERAIALAASLLAAGERETVAVGLAVPLVRLAATPRQDRRHLDRLQTALARLDLEAVEGARSRGDERFPEQAARSGACVVVHAGTALSSFGGRGARHVSGEELAELVAEDEETQRALAMLAPEARA